MASRRLRGTGSKDQVSVSEVCSDDDAPKTKEMNRKSPEIIPVPDVPSKKTEKIDIGSSKANAQREGQEHHTPLSHSSAKICKEMITQEQTQENTLEGFWDDQKIWFLVGLVGFSLVLQIGTLIYSNMNATSMQENSVPKDGYSSKGLSDVIDNQKREWEKIDKLESGYESLDYLFKDLKNEISEVKKQLLKCANIEENDISTSLLDEKLETIMNNIDKELQIKEASISTLEQKNEEKSQQIEALRVKIGEVDNLKSAMTQMTQKVDMMESHWNTLNSTYQSLDGKYMEMKINITSTTTKLEKLLDFFTKEFSELHLYIIIFLILMVIGVVFAAQKHLFKRPPQTSDRAVLPTQSHDQPLQPRPQQRVGGQELSHSSILEKMSAEKPKNGICVISFNSSTQMFHNKLLEAIHLPQTWPVKIYLINKREDLLKVPPQKVTILFVDFNERNIILENPETDIGDLRKSTAEIFLDIGCDVFVIYCRDKYSQSLAPPQLHSDRLNSIKQHPILAKLSKTKRVFSVYESLHPQQAAVLKGSLE